MVAADKDGNGPRAIAIQSVLIRTSLFESAPHGGAPSCCGALADPQTRAALGKRLGEMRDRIKAMRVTATLRSSALGAERRRNILAAWHVLVPATNRIRFILQRISGCVRTRPSVWR